MLARRFKACFERIATHQGAAPAEGDPLVSKATFHVALVDRIRSTR